MAEAPVARVCPFNGDTARESAAPLPAKTTMTVRGPGVWSVVRGRRQLKSQSTGGWPHATESAP